jgi:hypothetical protein
MKIICAIGPVVSAALGLAILYDSAYAQVAGCTVMEVGADQETSRHEIAIPPVKRAKAKSPKHQLQQEPVNEPETRPSTREAAFASGQSLANYCSFKVQLEDNR